MNYQQNFNTSYWKENTSLPILPTDTSNFSFDADMLVYTSKQYVSSLILYSHSTWTFETQEDASCYLTIFSQTIQKVAELFPHYVLYYIQNYERFDPSKQIAYIREESVIPPVSKALDIIPFERQRRVCKKPPQAVREAMPHVHFSQDIKTALVELWLN